MEWNGESGEGRGGGEINLNPFYLYAIWQGSNTLQNRTTSQNCLFFFFLNQVDLMKPNLSFT